MASQKEIDMLDPLLLRLDRRWFLKAAAGTAVAGLSAAAVGTLTAIPAFAATTVEPVYGSGLFDVDPSQAGVSQSPSVAVHGDVVSLPLDVNL
jgi:hypothetical protein